ncbi:hypothetical protein A2609_02020 [Candidatus Kaiserbacteria bacterium RIFOXYD1_FULL_47_14]|uniref:Uncharacterized protein n=1 Tax=Candidatus Kaiserbacteria bacterium RIFOXYD1_FULL_47_14 TaxID=1798533 RepID=A0A1F6G4F8_9BACT|nr:MAG: hypothetical protein A2609_02020 [Candidatus Kaiserbacteria bacterium RIFOXYD1_FULL_47_14]
MLLMYLAQLQFTPRTVNGFTPEFEALVLRETAYAEKYGKRYKTVKEALRAVGIKSHHHS